MQRFSLRRSVETFLGGFDFGMVTMEIEMGWLCNGSALEALSTNLFEFEALYYDYGDRFYGRCLESILTYHENHESKMES